MMGLLSKLKSFTDFFNLEKRYEKETGKDITIATGSLPISTVPFLPKSIIAGAGTILKSFGKALIPKTPLGFITKPLLGITAVTALIKSPKLRGKVKEAPVFLAEKAVTGGEIIADVVEGDSKVSIKDALITGGLVAGGVVAGAVIVPKVIEKVKSFGDDKVIVEEKPILPTTKEKVIGEAQSPILPETQSITPTKTTSKRRRAKKTPSVRQSVRINIINKPVGISSRITNKRFISQELLN